ncbi:MFS transporter [Streptomyces incarnatus]|uniref:MFS transporter n=1 Tax=Streptomyces incarnatus TaxID=665007 RepID=UPI0026A08029
MTPAHHNDTGTAAGIHPNGPVRGPWWSAARASDKQSVPSKCQEGHGGRAELAAHGGTHTNAVPRGALAVALLAVAQFLVVFDTTAFAVSLPLVARDRGLATAGLTWLLSAYSVCFAALPVLAGALGGAFGQRRVLTGGLALSSVAAAAPAVFTAGWVLMASRAVQGIAAAAMGGARPDRRDASGGPGPGPGAHGARRSRGLCRSGGAAALHRVGRRVRPAGPSGRGGRTAVPPPGVSGGAPGGTAGSPGSSGR